MNLITSTELRTKTTQIIDVLLSGGTIDLIHRSKVVGEIRPKRLEAKIFNAQRVGKIVEKLNLKPVSYKEVENRYRKHIMEKYGKGLSRHQ